MLLGDPEVRRFTRLPPPEPPELAREWLRGYEQARREGTREAWAVVEDGAFVGLAVAPSIDRGRRVAELGYAVVPAARGRGIATETLALLTDWGFGELGALRLELRILAENEGSRRVAARCGYVHERDELWALEA